jgi:hypothetical protein
VQNWPSYMYGRTARQDGKAALEHLWLLIVLALAYAASIVIIIGVIKPNAHTLWDGVAAVLLLGTLVTVVVLSWRDIYTFGGLMPWLRLPIALRILLAAGLIVAALFLWIPVILFLPPIQIVRGFADLARTRMPNSQIPKERADRIARVDGTMSATEVGDALESELATVRSRLPADVVSKLERIKETILDILPRAEDLGPEELFVVRRTAVDYLPVAIHSYMRLPRAYATKRPIAAGKTALQLLNDDLDLMETKLGDISEAIHRKDSDALIAHSRFLEDRFGRSSLTLPNG